jgi:two-component system heavy metal sensor histidine kinase CusS
MAQSHGVQIVVVPPPGAGITGEGVRDLLGRALDNLVRNSIQHSPQGATVRVAVKPGADEISVVVEDTGSSLGGSVRGTAFTALGQLSSKSVPNGRYSRGLGLYCAALAAAAAGATVRVVKASGETGNAFELAVPRSK